jgi:chromosome segregation ATPase
MTDIVARLRNFGATDMVPVLREEAAAEIERLRAELELAETEIEYRDRTEIFPADAKEAEIKRLRKAYASCDVEMDTMQAVLATTEDWIEQAMATIERLQERNVVLEIAHRQTNKALDNAYAESAELRTAIELLHVDAGDDSPAPQRPPASP